MPPRPAGNSPRARFMQWVWDAIAQHRPIHSPSQTVLATTRGFAIEPKQESKESVTDAGSLTSAVFDPATETIIGVRGGTVLQFDADAGRLQKGWVFAVPPCADSYVALLSPGKVIASHWFDPNFNIDSEDSIRRTSKGLYKIDTEDLNVDAFFKFTDPNGNNVVTFTAAPIDIVSVTTLEDGEEVTTEENDDGTTTLLDLNQVFPPVSDHRYDWSGGTFHYYSRHADDTIQTLVVSAPEGAAVIVQSCSPIGVGYLEVDGVMKPVLHPGDVVGSMGPGGSMSIKLMGNTTLLGFYPTPSDPSLSYLTLGFYNATGDTDFDFRHSSNFHVGPRSMVIDQNGKLWVTYLSSNGSSNYDDMWGLAVVDPLTGAVLDFESSVGFGSAFYTGIDYDSGTDTIVVSTGWGVVRFNWDTGGNQINWIDDDDFVLPANLSTDQYPLCGLAIAGGKVFLTTQSPKVWVTPLSDFGVTWDSFDLEDPAAGPRNVRYLGGLLWFAGMGSNSVLSTDLAGGSQTFYDGFDIPYDVVAGNGDKIFAVQMGLQSLKLVSG